MQFTVTSGTGPAELVDDLDSVKSALDRALTLIGRRWKNVRVHDEDRMARSLTDVRRLADQETLSRDADRRALAAWEVSRDRRRMTE